MKQKKKYKVGIIGEDFENDAKAMCTLLQNRPFDNTHFKALNIKGVTADNIESASAVGRRVFAEILSDDYNYVICIKDLDDTFNNVEKLKIKEKWFNTYKKVVGKEAICYLAVAEIEALLLADIEIINKKYGTKLKTYPNPQNVKDPKGELKAQTGSINLKKRYDQSHCNDLMKEIRFQNVYENHKGEGSFQEFINELDKIIS